MEVVILNNYKKVLDEIITQSKYPKDKKDLNVCTICLSKYSEPTYTEHKQTENHLKYIKLNDKLKKLKIK